jgi:hypothetical protein
MWWVKVNGDGQMDPGRICTLLDLLVREQQAIILEIRETPR